MMTVSLPEAGAGAGQDQQDEPQLLSAVSAPSSSTTATETACSELAKPSLTLSVPSVSGDDATISNVEAGSGELAKKLQPSDASSVYPPPSAADQREVLEANAGLYRLKIVGIPAGYSEEQLRSLFQLCGSVAESRIVHDKQSGRPVGYGYVSFFTKEAADLAISTFDDQLQLQGGANYLSVYYAKKQHDTTNDKESCPARNAKLYFCGTPAGLRRDSILALFSAFGRVRHLQVYTDSYGVLSSGTVTMYSTDEAIEAMNSLDGKVLQPGTAPLKVTWAQLSTLPRRNPAGGGPPPPMPRGFTVSYACIPTSVTPAEVAATFERFGMVLQVVPFAHRREGPANSRGCGLVVMDREPAAMAAVEALSGVFTWPGAERPLLVQPFYGADRVNPMTDLPGGFGGGPQPGQFGRGGSSGGGMRGPTNHNSAASAGPRGHPGRVYQQQPQQWSGNNHNQRGSPTALDAADLPPPGCAPEAFKLVLTNLPGSYTQTDIISLLQPYGSVISMTHMPTGEMGRDSTAAVWYQTAAQAEAALAALSNTVLMAAEGTRQLELKAFKRPAGAYGGNRGVQQAMAPAGPWHSPVATQGMPGMQQQQSPGLAAYQQHNPVLQQGAYSPAGQLLQQQQQGMLGDQRMNSMWVQAGGVGAGPPGLTGMAPNDNLAALAAVTAAMSAPSNAYSMQQLLCMLPQQQQLANGMAPAGGAWQNNMMMPGGAVTLSGNSNIDAALQSIQGGTEQALLGPSVSAAAGLLAPAGAGYTGWLG